MQTLKARVIDGRYVIEQPAVEPEGSIVTLVSANDDGEEDELDDAERAELHSSLERAALDSEAGQGMDALEFLRQRREARHTG